MLTAGPRNRIGAQGPQGPRGPQGDPGPDGERGPSPEFQWRGTEIRFRQPNGNWGKWIDLKGTKGDKGNTGLGMMGPQGPQGEPGPPAELLEFDTDTLTQPRDPVVITGADFVQKISDNTATTIPNGIFGFGVEKPSTTRIKVLFLGKLEGFSGLSIASRYFISTSGGITTTPPITGMVQQVGFAINSTTLLVDIKLPLRRAT
jgi:hypothetical protein